jgi:hypothetical protein
MHSHLLHVTFLLGRFSILNVEVTLASETSVLIPATRCYSPEEDIIRFLIISCILNIPFPVFMGVKSRCRRREPCDAHGCLLLICLTNSSEHKPLLHGRIALISHGCRWWSDRVLFNRLTIPNALRALCIIISWSRVNLDWGWLATIWCKPFYSILLVLLEFSVFYFFFDSAIMIFSRFKHSSSLLGLDYK